MNVKNCRITSRDGDRDRPAAHLDLYVSLLGLQLVKRTISILSALALVGSALTNSAMGYGRHPPPRTIQLTLGAATQREKMLGLSP
jgi:hypothetical protein